MTIVPAEPTDWPTLEQLFLQARLAAFHWQSQDQLLTDMLQPQCAGEAIWLACDQAGQPCGFISVWLPEYFIHHLYVAPSHQGQGVGQALLQALPDWGAQRYSLKCLQQNLAARAFYERQGFVEVESGDGADGPYWLLAHEGQ